MRLLRSTPAMKKMKKKKKKNMQRMTSHQSMKTTMTRLLVVMALQPAARPSRWEAPSEKVALTNLRCCRLQDLCRKP